MDRRSIVITLVAAMLAISCSASSADPAPTGTAELATAVAATATPVLDDRPYPAGSIGYAISWPQCGAPYPAEPFDFGIIGVNDGKAFTHNPCFAEEYRWAERGRYHPSVYMNVNYIDTAEELESWWSCGAADEACRAYRYGWVAAHDAWHYAASHDGAAPVWWLDVQIVSDWSKDLRLNAHAVRGARDYLSSSHDIRVGMSSTSYQWATVAGDAMHGLPVWDASASGLFQAAAFCTRGMDFGGGGTEQIAFVEDGFEVVLACGATGDDTTIHERGSRFDTP